jgi:hypothetical protein
MKQDIAASLKSKLSGLPLPLLATLFLVGTSLLLRLIFAWSSIAHLPATADEAFVALQAKMIFNGARPLLALGQPYLFPTEAYTMAPFIEWLPRTALGARYQSLILGFLSVFGFLLIVHTAFPKGERWPAGLLVLFPSAYLLMLTSAYSPYQYPIALTFIWMSIYLVLRSRQTPHNGLLLLAGLLCGLAWSSHLFTITMSSGIFALILFNGNLGRGVKGSFLFGGSFLIGAIPYLLAIMLEPGAYQNVPDVHSLAQTLSRVIKPLLTGTLAGAMGFNPTLYPDFAPQLNKSNDLRIVFAGFYVVLLGFLVVQRLLVFCRAVAARCWPTLSLVDMALSSSILILVWFASHGTGDTAYRYLLPAVWCFPLLVGHAYSSCKGHWRQLIGSLAIVLAVFNVATSKSVIKEWRKPGRIAKHAATPPIDSLLKVLESKKITHCYASFWLASRITFESDEKIICSMPCNERFAAWPTPYKEAVDSAPDAHYILWASKMLKLSPLTFQNHMKPLAIDYQTFKIEHDFGSFLVYHDFKYSRLQKERILPEDEYTVRQVSRSIGQQSAHGGGIKDWIYPIKQKILYQVTADLRTPQIVTQVTLSQFPVTPYITEKISVSVRDNENTPDQWRVLPQEDLTFEELEFHNNHPIYNKFSQFIRIKPTRVSALRVEVKEVDMEGQGDLPGIKITVSTDENTSGVPATKPL